MNLFCICTDTNPDFVGALLLAPPDDRFPARWPTWLCHDCYEQHVCEGYSIRVTRAVHLGGVLLPEGIE